MSMRAFDCCILNSSIATVYVSECKYVYTRLGNVSRDLRLGSPEIDSTPGNKKKKIPNKSSACTIHGLSKVMRSRERESIQQVAGDTTLFYVGKMYRCDYVKLSEWTCWWTVSVDITPSHNRL